MKNSREPIAIVGMGCRLPGGASTPLKLWNLLKQGFDGIIDVPSERWDMRRFYDSNPSQPGKMYVNKGGFLQEKIDQFDADFFHISPREAQSIDPQQRLLLEVTWEAMEDGGIVPSHLRGSQTGVFMGGFTTDWQNLRNNPHNIMSAGAYTGINSSQTILSARLAYFFDLKGPCLTIDTACSSSLAALHLAAQSIWHRECRMALAGGVNVMLTPEATIAMSKGHFLNPEGYCRSFDADAKGYVRGEGAGIVILKPLEAALKDRDHIYALIRATGINHDGQGSGLVIPNKEAQRQLISNVLEEAGICASQIQYIEAHGTGTSIGDPIEAWAIDQVLNRPSFRKQKCLLGSIKSNIGHLEAAAGIAGMIKTALCLKHRQIPPNLHFSKPSPSIAFDDTCLEIPTDCREFPEPNHTLYAGVNSFGYGGTNAHAVLQEHSVDSKIPIVHSLPKLFPFPFSAKNEDSLLELAKQMIDYLQGNPDISMADLAYSLSDRREHHPFRLNILAQTLPELLCKLKQFVQKEARPDILCGQALSDLPKMAFVFTGMGPQRCGMGLELYRCDDVFKNTLDKCSKILRALAGWQLIDELSSNKLDQPEYAQPANFAIQAALFELLKSKGVIPSAVVGHSIGEIASAYASGAISLEEGLCISYHRSRIQAARKGLGTMLAAETTLEQANEYINRFPDKLSIAAINSKSSVTFSGDEQTLQIVANEFEKGGAFYRFLKVNIAYHSHQMDGLESELLKSLHGLASQKPSTPLYSTVLGSELADIDLDASYWWQNIRKPVLFENALSAMIAKGNNVFIEIGPHPVLAKSINDSLQLNHSKGASLYTLHKQEPENKAIEALLGKLYSKGCPLQWNLLQPAAAKFISIPKYPWKKNYHWNESEDSRQYRLSLKGHTMLARRCKEPDEAWIVEVNRYFFKWLEDHKLDGSIVFPASAYVEAGISLYRQRNGVPACILENVDFIHPLVIPSGHEPLLRISSTPHSSHFNIQSSSNDSYEWTLHAKGCIKPLWKGYAPQPLDLINLKKKLSTEVSPQELYRQFKNKGMQYGPSFQLIKKIYKKSGEALTEILIPGNDDYILPPPVLDNALQSLIATFNLAEEHNGLILPIHIDEIHFFSLPKERVWCYSKGRLLKNDFKGDIQLCDDYGNVCVEIRGAICRLMQNEHQHHSYSENLFYHFKWEEVQTNPEPDKTFSLSKQYWALIFSDSEPASKLVWQLERHGAECSLGMPQDIREIQNLNILFHCSSPPQESYEKSELRITKELLHLVKHLESHRKNHSYSLWILTHSLQGSSAWGFARTLRNEHPLCKCRVIDIADIADFIQVLSHSSIEDETVLRQGKLYVPRLKPGLDFDLNKKVSPLVINTSSEAVELELSKPGSIANLRYKQSQRKIPNSGEVEVKVHTASLNFKDLMKVMGLLDAKAFEGTYFGESFGMEASGTIIKIGKGVRDYKEGDQVCIFIGNTFRSYITLPTESIFPIPFSATLEQAPIYIPFITVLRGLKEIAKLSKGETILIHSATGAVGLAAIQYARHVGAKIIATAGNQEKWEFLNSLGIDFVADSRSLHFSKQIQEWTHGRGVDVILNALSGEFLLKSWSLLASCGRFIEIGKRDITQNANLPMEVFNRNALFAAVDLDRIFFENKKAIHRLLRQAMRYFQQGVFKLLPCQTFPAAQCHEAFNMMAKALHIGKIMLKMENETLEVVPSDNSKSLLNENSTYMITGGLSGFGLATAKWIADKGGRHLLLLSRSGSSSSESREALKYLTERHIDVKVAAVDVGNLEQLETTFKKILPLMPPLKGIFHCAMVLEDSLISKMEEDHIQNVLHPKICGCWNLHLLSSELNLNFFVLYSSISSLIGNPGQANYAAANAFLDSFVQYRARLGLPALALNWGSISQVGVAARNTQLTAYLESCGIKALLPKQALNNLEVVLQNPHGRYAIMNVDWPQIFSSLPQLQNKPFFESIRTDQSKTLESDFCYVLRNMDKSKQQQALLALIKENVAAILQMDLNKIDEKAKLNILGIDSLMAMELQHAMEKQLGFKIPAMELIKGPSIEQLAQSLLRKIQD